MPDNHNLPTIWDSIWNWFGVQAPAIPLPQTLRNLDKAVGKIVLATGENVEAKIKSNTGKSKAQGKIDVAGMFRNEEDRRKLENRAAITKGAIEDILSKDDSSDAQVEIEDDWLNLFARLAEDKSSEALQGLFGKILAGEIRRPGSFSLRTVQLMATISKNDAEAVAEYLSFAMDKFVVAFVSDEAAGPSLALRLQMVELGLASHPSAIGGLAYNPTVPAKVGQVFGFSGLGLVVINNTDQPFALPVAGQVLSQAARELIPIANPRRTDFEYLKSVAKSVFAELKGRFQQNIESKLIEVLVVEIGATTGNQVQYKVLHTVSG